MKVLLVIDMLNGFCRKGYPLSLPDPTERIEKYITNRIEKTLQEGGKVIFLCDNHVPTDPEINNPYPPHCMQGTREAEIINELKPLAEKAIILPKHTLSIFLNTGLDKLLKKFKPEEVEVTGVCTDIVDLFAVYELRIRGYNVFITDEGVMPLDSGRQSKEIEFFKLRLGAKTH